MMSRPISQALRALAVVALCGLLAGCCSVNPIDEGLPRDDERWCGPEADTGYVVCWPVSKGNQCSRNSNVFTCFFHDYDNVSLKLEELKELRQALQDALALPIEELEKRRYADYMTVQNPTVVDIIERSFRSWSKIRAYGSVSRETPGFLQSLKLPESVPLLQKLLAEVEEDVRRCEETGDCEIDY